MRAELNKIMKTTHDKTCRYTADEEAGGIIYHCSPTCRIAAIGGGNGGKGVREWLRVAGIIWRKIGKRQRRMRRKKRRGWA
jgi:hypothetical protein